MENKPRLIIEGKYYNIVNYVSVKELGYNIIKGV